MRKSRTIKLLGFPRIEMKWFKRIIISLAVTVALLLAVGAGFVWYVFSDIQGREHVADQALIIDLEKNISHNTNTIIDRK